MAGLFGSVVIAEQALAASAAETLIQLLAATNHPIKLKRWGVFFDSTDVTAQPVEILIARQTTAGTGTDDTPNKLDETQSTAVQTTGRVTFSAEPTSGSILEVFEIHPQQGIAMIYPLGEEIIVGGGNRIGMIVTSPSIVNARAYMVFEE